MMTIESPQLLFFMGLMALCSILTALSLLLTANSIFRTSQRLNLLLDHSDHAVQEARQAFWKAGALLGSFRNFFGKHRGKRHVTHKRRVS